MDYSLEDPHNREMLKNKVASIYSYLSMMYHIPSAHKDEIQLLLLQHLGKTKHNSEYIVSTDVAMPWSDTTIYTFLQ
jgi:hypothetical protein